MGMCRHMCCRPQWRATPPQRRRSWSTASLRMQLVPISSWGHHANPPVAATPGSSSFPMHTMLAVPTQECHRRPRQRCSRRGCAIRQRGVHVAAALTRVTRQQRAKLDSTTDRESDQRLVDHDGTRSRCRRADRCPTLSGRTCPWRAPLGLSGVTPSCRNLFVRCIPRRQTSSKESDRPSPVTAVRSRQLPAA